MVVNPNPTLLNNLTFLTRHRRNPSTDISGLLEPENNFKGEGGPFELGKYSLDVDLLLTDALKALHDDAEHNEVLKRCMTSSQKCRAFIDLCKNLDQLRLQASDATLLTKWAPLWDHLMAKWVHYSDAEGKDIKDMHPELLHLESDLILVSCSRFLPITYFMKVLSLKPTPIPPSYISVPTHSNI